ncbi:hypothetical protein [Sporomusa acidovorans]|uniref:Uncharacterized protein n=1 Tax=Sporomusa acidovorans (strain ATCC 49682 / DSM 3132 / Mol) TaxID=1123286 RepID=A0ABZ3J267_SPOA4|nr:hypothetical protein [Sporomusa acidovorans]OZC18068.1 hypothetical protein SPACI_35870 [Sporomusa acidovorans DSM 3132]SDF73012.1 hypothetical protein SAMN04488499_107316 [Sporomusa acidovorans]
MLLIALEYLFNWGFFIVAVFLVLWLMEKIGKKRPAAWRERAALAAVMAAGATLLQLVVHAVTLVYCAGLAAGP